MPFSAARCCVLLLVALCADGSAFAEEPVAVSGRYPHLAMYNKQGECGTGAVVPWADRLWVITYAPHMPKGSDDKLYEIDASLNRIARPESVGGTPADRMIHRESDQLIIGPYFIDASRNVRVVSPAKMPGRLTAAARHLTDPANKVYVLDMEGALYEVDVHTLDVAPLFARMAPGAHCKGGYTSQGRLVMSNNGNIAATKAKPAFLPSEYASDPEAAGILAQWDGKDWTMVAARQFNDVTGPGGIEGAPAADSPLWAVGWDKRSVLLKLLDHCKWQTFRLPVADYSYVAKHGWYTEWPRIREVGAGKFLMNMHGQWFDFPKSFSAADTAGIRPIGTYLKITADFCNWNGRLVFACDDASLMNNPLCSQSQSNLWFTTRDDLARHGAPAGDGGPWVNDAVQAEKASDPYLIARYTRRMLHLANGSDHPVRFTLEIDADGKGTWATYQTLSVPARGYAYHLIPDDVPGEWMRLKTDVDCDRATAYFHYGRGGGAMTDRALFAALPDAADKQDWIAATVRPLAEDPGSLWVNPRLIDAGGKPIANHPLAPVLVGADLKVHPCAGEHANEFTLYESGEGMKVRSHAANPSEEPKSVGVAENYAVTMDDSSIIVTQAKKRYRLPISTPLPLMRPVREVVTERFLLNAGGSFFMLPYPTAGGASRIKPLCTHDKRISDFCSWRGLMVLAGARPDAKGDGHFGSSGPGAAGVWLGDIDDLWKLGPPRGHGGPWNGQAVQAGEASDPFLMAGYDHKTVALSHDAGSPVKITLEVDFLADGSWSEFKSFDVPAGKTITYEFPAGYSAHWVRAKADTACKATVRFGYD